MSAGASTMGTKAVQTRIERFFEPLAAGPKAQPAQLVRTSGAKRQRSRGDACPLTAAGASALNRIAGELSDLAGAWDALAAMSAQVSVLADAAQRAVDREQPPSGPADMLSTLADDAAVIITAFCAAHDLAVMRRVSRGIGRRARHELVSSTRLARITPALERDELPSREQRLAALESHPEARRCALRQLLEQIAAPGVVLPGAGWGARGSAGLTMRAASDALVGQLARAAGHLKLAADEGGGDGSYEDIPCPVQGRWAQTFCPNTTLGMFELVDEGRTLRNGRPVYKQVGCHPGRCCVCLYYRGHAEWVVGYDPLATKDGPPPYFWRVASAALTPDRIAGTWRRLCLPAGRTHHTDSNAAETGDWRVWGSFQASAASEKEFCDCNLAQVCVSVVCNFFKFGGAPRFHVGMLGAFECKEMDSGDDECRTCGDDYARFNGRPTYTLCQTGPGDETYQGGRQRDIYLWCHLRHGHKNAWYIGPDHKVENAGLRVESNALAATWIAEDAPWEEWDPRKRMWAKRAVFTKSRDHCQGCNADEDPIRPLRQCKNIEHHFASTIGWATNCIGFGCERCILTCARCGSFCCHACTTIDDAAHRVCHSCDHEQPFTELLDDGFLRSNRRLGYDALGSA